MVLGDLGGGSLPPHSSSTCSHFFCDLIGIWYFSLLAGPFRKRVISGESPSHHSHQQGLLKRCPWPCLPGLLPPRRLCPTPLPPSLPQGSPQPRPLPALGLGCVRQASPRSKTLCRAVGGLRRELKAASAGPCHEGARSTHGLLWGRELGSALAITRLMRGVKVEDMRRRRKSRGTAALLASGALPWPE